MSSLQLSSQNKCSTLPVCLSVCLLVCPSGGLSPWACLWWGPAGSGRWVPAGDKGPPAAPRPRPAGVRTAAEPVAGAQRAHTTGTRATETAPAIPLVMYKRVKFASDCFISTGPTRMLLAWSFGGNETRSKGNPRLHPLCSFYTQLFCTRQNKNSTSKGDIAWVNNHKSLVASRPRFFKSRLALSRIKSTTFPPVYS